MLDVFGAMAQQPNYLVVNVQSVSLGRLVIGSVGNFIEFIGHRTTSISHLTGLGILAPCRGLVALKNAEARDTWP